MKAGKDTMKFSYLISDGITSGAFNIYQSRSGAIFILMGNRYTRLTRQQIEDLGINVYSLIDFDLDAFLNAYKLEATTTA